MFRRQETAFLKNKKDRIRLKKHFFFAAVLFSLATLAASPVPSLLGGIWENADRMVVFDTGLDSIQIVLKPFYGRYADRAAESSVYTKENVRDRNSATSSSAADVIGIECIPLAEELAAGDSNGVVQANGDVLLAENESSGAWILKLRYGKEDVFVPVARIGNNLYLDFVLREENSDNVASSSALNGTTLSSEHPADGFWYDAGRASGITLSKPFYKTELLSYLVDADKIYHIRYWRSDMDFDSLAQAVFRDADSEYSVPKHLRFAGQTFTCVNGKGTRIRNIERSGSFPKTARMNSVIVKKERTNSDGLKVFYNVRTSTICAFGEPYLTLHSGSETIEQIVKEMNSQKMPAPKPLFPPHGVLDFDWSIIENPPKDYNRRVLDLGK